VRTGRASSLHVSADPLTHSIINLHAIIKREGRVGEEEKREKGSERKGESE
jgi:hypothetical protein